MKLLRVGPVGEEKPALLDESDIIRDLSSIIEDVNGASLGADSLANLAQIDISQLPEVASSVRIGPCVGGVGKIICIGLNYTDHAEEVGAQIPREPIIFAKATQPKLIGKWSLQWSLAKQLNTLARKMPLIM